MASEGSGGPSLAGKGTKVRYCAVYNCLHNYKTHPNLTYFTIPTTPKRCLKWLQRIRRMDILKNGKVSAYNRVCEVHFRPQDIVLTASGSRRRLLARALPALRLPHHEPYVAVLPAPRPRRLPAPPERTPEPPSAGARGLATSELEIFEYVDRTRRPPAVARLRPRTSTGRGARRPPPTPPGELAEFFAACDRHLNGDMADFVKRMARFAKSNEERPSDGAHARSARLLVGAPAAYRLLAPALALPPAAAVRRALLRRGPDELADLLRLRARRMTELERLCTVSLDLVDVRPHLYYDTAADRIVGLHETSGVQEPEPARHCAVLSARALFGTWAQPVALCFLAAPDAGLLHAWTDAVLRRLLAAGLQVRALVADPEAPAARRPGVDAARPFFGVDGHKIYVIYDPPRLMRLLLCEFVAHDFHFEGSIARWADVSRFRELERRRPFPLLPALAGALPSSAAPRHARRLRPRRAARLLARPLAAALADCGRDALATAKFIFKMNDLYDALDSPATAAGRDSAGASTCDSGDAGFLEYMRSFFGRLELKDEAGVESPNSKGLVERWQVSIASVMALRERLAPLGLTLPTRRVRLDDRVTTAARRVAAGPPACRQVSWAFKKRFVADILRSTDEEATVDLHEFLERANSNDATATGGRERFDFEEEEEAEIWPSDYRGGWQRRASVSAAAARVLRAVRRVHGGCAAAAGWLAGAPPAELRWLLHQLDAALLSALRSPQQAAAGRLADLLLDVHVLDCEVPCGCFPLQFLKRLFLRMRLHDILRRNQAEFKKGGEDIEFYLDALE